MAYTTILFDLDGTLTDPGVGITRSVAHALHRFGIEVADHTTLYPFIGPPLIPSFQRYYGFSAEQAAQAVAYYREYFAVTGMFENEVYPGIETMLQTLLAAGKTLVLATSKPESFALQIMQHFQLDKYFAVMAGSRMDETRTGKDEVIAYVLKIAGVTDTTSAIMVGDREYDVAGAQQNGLGAIGVLYGYGSREELERAGADHIAANVEELQSLLLAE